MDRARLVKISKYLARHLRHAPDRIGIRLDAGGWVEVDALLAACNARGFRLTRAGLDEVVRRNDKRRYAYDAAGGRIRASQGHSVAVDLGLAPTEPPPLLFHGTTAEALPAIRADGLRPMRRLGGPPLARRGDRAAGRRPARAARRAGRGRGRHDARRARVHQKRERGLAGRRRTAVLPATGW